MVKSIWRSRAGRMMAVLVMMSIAATPAMAAVDLPPPPHLSCDVTRPNAEGRPDRWPNVEEYYGNDELWTLLWPRGRMIFAPDGPGFILPDGGLGMKWPWIPLVPGELTVTGRRLDAEAPPLRVEISTGVTDQGQFFYPTYLIFATPSCWEVTGRVGAQPLTFVTEVIQVGAGPSWRPATIP